VSAHTHIRTHFVLLRSLSQTRARSTICCLALWRPTTIPTTFLQLPCRGIFFGIISYERCRNSSNGHFVLAATTTLCPIGKRNDAIYNNSNKAKVQFCKHCKNKTKSTCIAPLSVAQCVCVRLVLWVKRVKEIDRLGLWEWVCNVSVSVGASAA